MRAIDNLDLFTNGVTITAEYDSEYYDKTITCSNGVTTYTATTTSSGQTTFMVTQPGTWTVTCDGNSASVTVATAYNVSMIPDGKTVTPTDDIQVWLSCAGINNKSYTTLAEVLADTDTLSALIASENAVDYMVRSTTWAVSTSVPTMTSNTSPSGECFGNSHVYGSNYYHAFDDSSSTYVGANANQVNGLLLGYKFTSPISVGAIKFWNRQNNPDAPTYGISHYKLQGSNDNGLTWTDITSELVMGNPYSTTPWVQEISNASTYKMVGLYVINAWNGASTTQTTTEYCNINKIQFYSTSVTNNSAAMTLIGANNYCANTLLADSTWCNAICNSEYFESVLNVKAPKMTSNTTPEGVCASVNGLGTGSAYNVFDRNSSTYAQPNQYPCIIGYTFTATKKIYMAVAEFEAGRTPGNFKIQYAESSSLTPGTDIKTVSSPSLITKVIFDSAVEKSSFCFNSSSNGTQGWLRVKNLQFYGREDV